jgi:hypothetical protein
MYERYGDLAWDIVTIVIGITKGIRQGHAAPWSPDFTTDPPQGLRSGGETTADRIYSIDVCSAPNSAILSEAATSRIRTFIRKNGSSSLTSDIARMRMWQCQ